MVGWNQIRLHERGQRNESVGLRRLLLHLKINYDRAREDQRKKWHLTNATPIDTEIMTGPKIRWHTRLVPIGRMTTKFRNHFVLVSPISGYRAYERGRRCTEISAYLVVVYRRSMVKGIPPVMSVDNFGVVSALCTWRCHNDRSIR
jgi:hypothetical protein